MIGNTPRAAARYQRARQFADLHFYQKWRAVWPQLSRLPHRGLRFLDAGCGDGMWSAEIAARRPEWVVTGVDRDEAGIALARQRAASLALPNLSFVHSDFSAFEPPAPFDVVLSICSAHYGATVAGSQPLFLQLHDWLAPNGRVIMLLPRCLPEAPFVDRLTKPVWHQLFSRQNLTELCAHGDLTAETIQPCVGPVGTLAKQLDWTRAAELRQPLSSLVAVFARGLAVADAWVSVPADRSLLWLMVAHRKASA